jgi:integrase
VDCQLDDLLIHSTISPVTTPPKALDSAKVKVGDRRRKRGSGGVVNLGNRTWRVDVEIARDAVTGRRRRVSRTVRGSRADAELALSRLKVADHEKRLLSGGTNARSVKAALALYQETAERGSLQLAPKTLTTTRSAIKVMVLTELQDGRLFGAIALSRLTWQDIELLYTAMRKSGRGPDWIRRCATVLTRALELARKRGLIDSNPSKDAVRPKSVRTKPFAPTESEVRAVLEIVSATDPDLAGLAILVASTGIRTGEALGLTWSDVDLLAGEIHIAAAISDGGPGVGVVRKPTKRSDWRDVPLTATALAALRQRANNFQTLFGQPPSSAAYVFAGSPDGVDPLRPDALSHRWGRSRGESQVTLLALRHYVATVTLDAGESYRTVADILGNSEATLRLHYDGRTGIDKRNAVRALEL